VAFGLDLFETALRRNKFDFRDGPILARLESMVPVIGNTLYSSSTPVLILGLKAASGLVRCPLKSLGKSAPVFVRQVIDIIQATGSTESEVVQTCFKSLAGIIRDGQSVQVKEKDLAYLLELLSPDLEEPLRQASVFAMLRAIISRKFIVPEIYDLMDKVSEILVTSQSPQVQEQCRGVFLQFLLDYPQGKGRLRNQMTFLAKNLTYVHDNGRQSVMELLSAVLSKFEISLVREYGDLFFIALVMVIVNDESAKCREMASELIKSLISRLDDSHRRIMVSHLHSWASQHSKPQLARVSSQVSGLLIDVLQADSLPYISEILEDTSSALKRSAQEWDSAKEENDMDTDIEWQIPYHALIVAEKIARTYPDLITQPNKIPWAPVVAHLLFPHAWVRTASCRLLGQLFAAVAPGPPPLSSPSPDSPLTRERMLEIARNLCIQLKSEHLDDVLSTQIVKNLLFVGKSFYAIPIMPSDEVEEEDSGEDADASRTDEMKKQNPLPWLFSTLSYQVRSAHIARRNRTFSAPNWTQQPSSILKWFAAMASQMDPPRLEEFLVHILTPVYRLVEDDTIRDSQMSELKTLATELQDLVQRRVGTTAFSSTYSKIRQGALTIRRERKVAKLTQATTNPEAAAKRKLQRNVLKKDSRKRKDRAFGDRKGRTKRRRED
jgi:U3 small nucleolar RNA-associated protein 20